MINPPTMASPSGRRISPPLPKLSANGMAPSIAAEVVIRIGRKAQQARFENCVIGAQIARNARQICRIEIEQRIRGLEFFLTTRTVGLPDLAAVAAILRNRFRVLSWSATD